LSVKVENGWVTISGEVAHSYQKSCAEADVRRVSGVRGVTNGIDIEATVSKAASVPPGLAPIAATARAAPR
jgi:osmotically-inducible protein OsmY